MPRINLKQFYRGRATNENLIAPGVYESDDPALYGLADYLVNELKFATWVDDAPRRASAPVTVPNLVPPVQDTIEGIAPTTPAIETPIVPPVEPPADEPEGVQRTDAIDYDEMPFELVRAEAAKRDLLNDVVGTGKDGRVTKADIVAALVAADARG